VKFYLQSLLSVILILLISSPIFAGSSPKITINITNIRENGKPVKKTDDIKVVFPRSSPPATLAAFNIKLSDEKVSYTTAASKVEIDSKGRVLCQRPPQRLKPKDLQPSLKDRHYQVKIKIESGETDFLPGEISMDLEYKIDDPEPSTSSVFIPVSGDNTYNTEMINDMVNLTIEFTEKKLRENLKKRISLNKNIEASEFTIPLSISFDILDDAKNRINVNTRLFANIKMDRISLDSGVEFLEDDRYSAGTEVTVSKIVWNMGEVKVIIGGQVSYTYRADISENPEKHDVSTGVFIRIF
jgi:hypothetical protein